MMTDTVLYARAVGWSVATPILIRVFKIVKLFKFITPAHNNRPVPGMDKKISIATDRVMSVTGVFGRKPKCLWRCIVLYRLLRTYGYNAAIKIGVKKTDDGKVEGHSWIELDGTLYSDDNEVVRQFVVICDSNLV